MRYSLLVSFTWFLFISCIGQTAEVTFNRDIRPILSDTCFTCHGPSKPGRKGDLRLDKPDDVYSDRDGYHLVVPGHPEKSELYQRIIKSGRGHMPPKRSGRQLTAKQIELIKQWIEQGAEWEKHWAFIPPERPSLPKVDNQTWANCEIDQFILARLEKEKLLPSAQASKEKLIRRVTLDLTGLPPTLDEIDQFLNDDSPNAYENLVDRLLASPSYGEHFANGWLDAARYADTNGYQQDRTRTLWPWRDWLIQALNHNMPFDQFTIEQLAGDLIPNATTSQKVATGFNRNHMLNGEGGRIAEESRVEYVMDRVDTTSTIWLGLTMACARCHDHKYDPISQKEFYQFYGYFNSIDERGNVDRGGNANPVLPLPTEKQRGEQQSLKKQIAKLSKDKAKNKKQIDKLQKALQKLEKSFLETMVMRERKQPRDTYLLDRGQWDKPDKSEKLTPGVPNAFSESVKNPPTNRLALANWIISSDNPLTARVIVNRYWQHFFGTGLVSTSEDFGSQGARASHPELLDWLATEFIRLQWNVKALHRQIVTSSTYRQSAKVTPKHLQRDPRNRLLSRGPRYRLTSQALRDQVLALSGLLVKQIGGAPVKPYQPDGIWSDLSLGKISYKRDSGQKLYRRSVYTFWRRSVGPTMLFDSPARQVCTVRQARTNTPLHALTLMNDITYVEAARVLAQRLLHEFDKPQARLENAFRRTTGRRPQPREIETLMNVYRTTLDQYISDQESAKKLIETGEYPVDKALDVSELAATTTVINLIFNLDEVLNK